MNSFTFACPLCRSPLEPVHPDRLACPRDKTVYDRVDGIWRCLPPERLAFFRPFIEDYEAIRRAEGRGAENPAYYRLLPYRDLSGRFSQDWSIRAASFRTLLRKVIEPLESHRKELKILDLGAGNGWLSNRLAQRGHHVAAVDLLTNAFDGLGAFCHYETAFLPLQAEFDRLPLAGGQVDLVIFNASFHYTVDAAATLEEAQRLLMPGGRLVILDTPLYRDPASGEQMVMERRRAFQARYGRASDRLPSENYLTLGRLQALSVETHIPWKTITPFYGLRWLLRPLKARLLGRREPARFVLFVGKPGHSPTDSKGHG